MRLLVVGDVHAPRTAALQRALVLEGWPAAEVVSYARFPKLRSADSMRIRLDAPVRGEDDAAFLGYVPRRGEWIPRQRWFRGFREALRAIAAPNTGDVETMCDKLACHELFARASIPHPQLLGEVRTFEQLRAMAASAGIPRIFLKPVYGSSGAGIVAMALTRDRVQAWTTVESADGTLFNTRRIRVERDVTRLAALVDALCARDRMFAERWIAKAGFDGRTFDLRIVTVAGEIARIVVRSSGTPITNLHLRNGRHDVDVIRARIANDVWARAMDSALRAAACFPDSLAAGIDLAFTSRLDDHRVLEINAFGDYARTDDDDGSEIYRRELQVAFSPPRRGEGARSADEPQVAFSPPQRGEGARSADEGSSSHHATTSRLDARNAIGTCDVLLMTFDTLRFDVASEALREGLTPNLAALLPAHGWELRHSPGSFTWSAHQSFFAGFLPTPAAPGLHPRLFALAFAGSETVDERTCVLDAPDLVSGLRGRGYHAICIGGVGFFSKQNAISRAMPALFDESHWAPELGVTSERSTELQVRIACERLDAVEKRVFLFINVSALHQPNNIFVDVKTRPAIDSAATQKAALAYVDAQLPPLLAAMRRRGRWLAVFCSDHGTAYGEDGYRGHRLAHEVVWNVPYAEVLL